MMVQTKNLSKTFSTRNTIVHSVKDVSISIKSGEIFGFIGPNGAGKSTTMRILSTLIEPTGGKAYIAGLDIVSDAQKVRKLLGYVSQNGGLDQFFNAEENLIFQGQLHGFTKEAARQRALELISLFDLGSFAQRRITTYSGGQRRRVDIAMALVHKPKLLFLDEPTTGLDPQSRAHVWQEIKKIRDTGTTIFLTTHYLDEVDALCDRIAIIDHGTIVAEGTTHELKRTIASDLITLTMTDIFLENAFHLLKAQSYVKDVITLRGALKISVESGERALPQLIRLFDSAQVAVETISIIKPSLDDVFLKTTGRTLREETL